jgi:hypothetical protein
MAVCCVFTWKTGKDEKLMTVMSSIPEEMKGPESHFLRILLPFISMEHL